MINKSSLYLFKQCWVRKDSGRELKFNTKFINIILIIYAVMTNATNLSCNKEKIINMEFDKS